jgi:DHA2 family multidrug resistance protein-like MFS transporter
MQTSNEFGLGLGVALLGTVATSVYRGSLDGTIPAGLPDNVAASARESIDGAISAAAQVPGAQGADLLAAARDAFTDALHSVGIISAIAFVALAGLSAIALRNKSKGGQSGEANEEPPEQAQAA